jgi:hypothetical protein
MTRGTRALLTILVCGSLLMATTVGISVAAVYRAGSIAVQVNEGDGQQLRVAVPAGLARIAIWLTPASVLEPVMVDELRPLVPALRAGWREFGNTPDFVLVEVRDGDDRVRVEKRGHAIVVLVESDESTVRVALPLATVGPLLSKLERASALRA